ncbi:MAG: FMN-binding protein [Geothrix sp.]|uniref:FMN-binding protein n=1 Tax=Geothrix sp. TaxID=1962974 RepID=UPI0017FBD66B|nr:FMN-binding protein [Geothrix sp.]NWJ41411.1 FMN-binding protein [Geothrix sp.]WIL20602.1 MAG: FMN-binding protein [Geothrix sp.]
MIRILAPLALTLPLVAALPTTQEALALAFPGAQLTRKEQVLSEAQVARVKTLAQVDLPGSWLVAYEARRNGVLVGVGFFDTHRVRTLNETLLVAISAEGRILRVEAVAFREPAEYMAKEAWVRQFEGRGLDPQLSLKAAIHPLAGATLTAHAMTDAARRCLALHRILYQEAR